MVTRSGGAGDCHVEGEDTRWKGRRVVGRDGAGDCHVGFQWSRFGGSDAKWEVAVVTTVVVAMSGSHDGDTLWRCW